MQEQAQAGCKGNGFYIRVFLLMEGLVLAFAGIFYVSCKIGRASCREIVSAVV